MAYKQLFFEQKREKKIILGAAALADTVRVTLGPKTKCVLIGKKSGRPLVCNDGVTIANVSGAFICCVFCLISSEVHRQRERLEKRLPRQVRP